MMKTFILLTSLLLLITGCSAVVSPTPFGLVQPHLDSDEITGTWLSEGEEACQITVYDPTNGILEVTINESSDPSRPKHRIFFAHLRFGKKWHYVSVPMDEDGSSKDGFTFACYHFTPSRIVAWIPDAKKFRQLIETGVIDGRIERGQLYINEVTPDLIDLVESEEHGLLFDWREPHMIYKKKEKSVEHVPPRDSVPAARPPSP
jgi:hypothetical protein